MKILHVFHNSGLKNGVDKTTCTLIVALQKRGIMSVAIVPAVGEVTEFLSALGITYYTVPYSCCTADAWRAKFRFLADSAQQHHRVITIIEQEKPDVVHLNTGHLLHAGLAAAHCKIPAIWHIHAPFDNDLKRYQPAIGEGGYRWILENLSSQIIGVSHDVSNSLCEQIPSKRIKTLYNGIDIEALQQAALTGTTNIRNELKLPCDAKLILGVGRISAQKDFAGFARVADRVCRANANAFFIIAGPKEEPDAVQQLEGEIKRLGLSNKLFALGPRSDVPALVAQSDAFLSTAIFEGQGIAALEAMALTRPVVAMACQGLRECIQDDIDGVLVEPGNEAAAAAAIINILDEPALAKRLGNNGIATVTRRFSSEEYAREFVLIAKAAIANGPAIASTDALSMCQGLLGEINTAHRKLLAFEQQTKIQRLRLLLWQLFHPS